MIEEQCLFRVDKKRFMAIYLQTNGIANVSMVLKMQSNQIPNDLEKFLLAVRDMEKWFEYKKDFKQLFEGYAEAKENILTCIDTFNLSGHPRCFKSACKNGLIIDDERSRMMSMSDLTEQFSA